MKEKEYQVYFFSNGISILTLTLDLDIVKVFNILFLESKCTTPMNDTIKNFLN